MFEIIVIGAAILLIPIVVLYLIWRLMFGGMLRTVIGQFFNIAHKRDSQVDPEAPILPSTRQPISDLMRQQAEQMKPAPIGTEPQVPRASIAATSSDRKTRYEPPYRENPVTIEEGNQTIPQPDNNLIAEPIQAFVEDTSFKVDDPIIDQQYIDPSTPSASTLEAHLSEEDKSPYGVRSADHSPGRVLRDKRYRRNASGN
jgi:hypothetical protein